MPQYETFNIQSIMLGRIVSIHSLYGASDVLCYDFNTGLAQGRLLDTVFNVYTYVYHVESILSLYSSGAYCALTVAIVEVSLLSHRDLV